jgi:F0F1-type ATP synthase membrane subunit c/vacuolar-type H+-ATPase subunit K
MHPRPWIISFNTFERTASYGQRAIQTCSHCMSEADYALHALPPALLSYTLAAAMLGAVTVRGTARESRRSISLMLLVFAALVEAYWAYTVPIRIPSRQKQQNGSRDETIMVCTVLCTIITHSSPPTHSYTLT